MPNRRWFVQRTNPEYIKYLCRAASVSPAFAQILINRGIKTPDEIRRFISPTMDSLSDALELPGMLEATSVIKEAVKSGKRILVHGDYDTDGLTGTAIMVSALERLGGEVAYFIPDRLSHGYGFNKVGVDFASDMGAHLVVTVDCGITSFEAVDLAKARGIEVVITDHHEPKRDDSGSPILPRAAAVVNPRIDGRAPLLSGSAVAYKVAMALINPSDVADLLDLACLGTVADVIPLIEDSRVIVKEGLRLIDESMRPGVKALKEVSGINGRAVSTGLLSFTLIPRLNASGRIDNANDVIRLLLTGDVDEAYSIARRLNELNSKRQRIEEEVQNEAFEQLKLKGFDLSIVLASEGWHEGVVGIVAARLAEAYYRPAFVFNIKGDIAKGSARSIPSFDLYEGISKCRDLLLAFGGHRQAAGLKLKVENLEEFEHRMNQIISETLSDEDLIPTLTIDASVSLKEVNFNLLREISLLEPLGCGNPEPILGTKGLEFVDPRVVGNNHLKVRLREKSISLDAIGFDMGGMLEMLDGTNSVDVAYTPKLNEWEGGKTLQIRLAGIRPAR